MGTTDYSIYQYKHTAVKERVSAFEPYTLHRQWAGLCVYSTLHVLHQLDRAAVLPVNGCKECLDLFLRVGIAGQESSTVTGQTVKTLQSTINIQHLFERNGTLTTVCMHTQVHSSVCVCMHVGYRMSTTMDSAVSEYEFYIGSSNVPRVQTVKIGQSTRAVYMSSCHTGQPLTPTCQLDQSLNFIAIYGDQAISDADSLMIHILSATNTMESLYSGHHRDPAGCPV